ncbi:chitooligosaccharidolytic beta-N-acetylglucosaminidase [Prorops nasuta]|uniref:chitooligosaccharidolytic beta-N-acetylglucosaminidase n=1 Tax=Prorops nasuta TaxID=863751 RepID=UPI0034CE0B0A
MKAILSESIKPCRCRSPTTVRQTAALLIGLTGMISFLIAILILHLSANNAEEYNSPWHYKCDAGLCKKVPITEEIERPASLGVCQLFCGQYGTLWPKPTGHVSIGNRVVQLDPDNIDLEGLSTRTAAGGLLKKNVELLKKNVRRMGGKLAKSGGTRLVVHVDHNLNVNDVKLTLDTNESYTLQIRPLSDGTLNATITSASYFGARHALETLSQLIVYDDLRDYVQVVQDVYISDSPVYPYRGILLDTSRNFMDKESILRTIDAMAMSKMNTFHWHITDSQSFPYVSKTLPNLSKYGAYSPDKIYSPEDIEEIIEFGLLRGVRVLPEFDAPAHVGEGWQWVGNDSMVCFKAEPWQSFCVEPPCGQLNPTSETVYQTLEAIYKDMIIDFKPDIFHMGGDEVSIKCWSSSEQINNWIVSKGWPLSPPSYYLLWNYFQQRAFEKLTKANKGKEMPVILWTSGLTNEENIKFLDPQKYIIQIWTTGADATIDRLLKNNFKMIFSNYDALYLDCGFGAWVGEGNNWCSPYKGWQKIYENSPLNIVTRKGYAAKKNLILGGEATLWSEQVDSTSVDSRLWPRSAALAERLWAEPKSSWIHAEQRMLQHRERLVRRGIFADSLEPEWCLQNQGSCYL